MNLIYLILICILITIISGVITGFIRKVTIKHNLFDIPNNRSSHDIPKPKGGGISIVLTLIITILIVLNYGKIETEILISLMFGLLVVGFTGAVDDYKNLPAIYRGIIYLVVSILCIQLIGGFPSFSINQYHIELGMLGSVLATLFIVWLINLYNFMDGTDGLASIQAICVCIFIGISLFSTNNMQLAVIFFCLLSSIIGFLYWNWAPAKIFMGDVGSCSLGFLFGLFSIYTEKQGLISISVWIILLSPFIGDTTYTLFNRIINREKWYVAHNTHAYQKLYRLGFSHAKLALVLLLLNIVIIWPLAYIANSFKNLEISMIILSYLIIGSIWIITFYKYQKFRELTS